MTETPSSHNPALVFDREAVRRARERANARLADHDFLHRHVAEEISDRLLAVKRDFANALEIGARSGAFAETRVGEALPKLAGFDMVRPEQRTRHNPFFTGDEEALPFPSEAFDLIAAPLCLHAVNDLPGTLVQIRRALKPDGFFIGTLFGGETLTELRQAMMEAELEVTGGVSPHVAPFVDVRDAGHLLQRAGLALPVADAEPLTIRYDNALALMADLRGMGETNALAERRRVPTRRATIMRAAQIYAEKFADDDGRIRASFEVIYLGGWAPDESQQKPLRPGSARTRLADALGVDEKKV